MYYMLSRVEHEERFIISRPDFIILRYYIETLPFYLNLLRE